MKINPILIGQRIKSIRKTQKMTQQALSEKVYITPSFLSHIEDGTKTMSLPVFISIANALNTSADDLLLGNLISPGKKSDNEISSIFWDCTEAEKDLLLHAMKSIKKSLREYGKRSNQQNKSNHRYNE